MTEKEKKVIFSLLGIILLILLVLVVAKAFDGKKTNNDIKPQAELKNEKYVEKLDDGTRLNNSKEFNKDKKFKNLEISNIQFTSNNGNSVLLADVKNASSSVHEMEIVEVTIIGTNGEVIETLAPVIGKINPGETIQLNAIATADLVNAKDFIIKEK